MLRASRTLAAWIAVGLATGGCGAPLPDQTVNGRWVAYHHWAEEVPCDEAIDHLDALADFVAADFGLRPARFDYFKFRSFEEPLTLEHCDQLAAACERDGRAFSRGWSHDHEAVHAIFSPVGSPPPLFQEGLAMVYGCGTGGGSAAAIDPDTDLERLIAPGEWRPEYASRGQFNYAAAGSFVRYLLDTLGKQRFLSLYREAPHSEQARDTFQQVYGVSFDEAVASWRASGVWQRMNFCILENDPCLAPELDVASPGSITKPLSCLTATVGVAASAAGGVAVGIRSSELPITTSIESCEAAPDFADLVIAPELAGPRNSSTQHLRTPGKELAVRSFGLGPRARLRVSPIRPEDAFGAAVAPEGAPYGGPSGGEVTFRTLEEPDRLLTDGCPAAPLPLGDDVWALHLSAPFAAIPLDGGTVVLQSARPFRPLGTVSTGLIARQVCGNPCGLGETCPASGLQTVFSVRIEPFYGSPPPVRFSIGLILDH